MTNYRALVPGGFFSDMTNNALKPSVRFNNPGAINGAAWEKVYPGFVKTQIIFGNNPASIFEAPEYGVAVWWTLLKHYNDAGAKTIHDIITKYGGSADYSSYVRFVVQHSGMSQDTVIKLDDDQQLLKFAKAMFQMEAGAPSPLHDDQILYGIKFGRDHLNGKTTAAPDKAVIAPPTTALGGHWWSGIFELIGRFLSHQTSPANQIKATAISLSRVLKKGDKGDDVASVQTRLRSIGYNDITIDGDFGDATDHAVRTFQLARNLDPDGEVGDMTIAELNSADASATKPPLLNPPVTAQELWTPPWYPVAVSLIGFHETGVNQGLDRLIKMAGIGSNGWQWCSLFIQACLKQGGGYPGTGSGLARSFEINEHFIHLDKPCLGAIATMWRGAKVPRGTGHVFFYDGESAKGLRGIGGNESDMVKRSFHDRGHFVGYYWPKTCPVPAKVGVIPVGSDGSTLATKVT